MSTALATQNGQAPARTAPMPEVMERVIAMGDLSRLSAEDRIAYYAARCEAAGLDPRTQPFQYLSLQGKLTLYATKTATDQLIAIHRLTVEIVERRHDRDMGIYEVHCRVRFPDGHHVEDFAALSVKGLQGDALCNALMKCYHPRTEMLTSEGWVAIPFVTRETEVAQYDAKTRQITFARPKALIKTDTDIWIDVSDNISRQVVTPNHDVLAGDRKIEAADLMALESNIKKWRGSDQLPPIPVSGHYEGRGLEIGDAEIRLLAAFLSDGAWTPSESQVQFGFHKLRKADRLRELLLAADLPYSENVYDVAHNERFDTEYETRVVFYVKRPAAWFFGHYLTGQKALTMRTILGMTDRQARLLVEEMQFWDGCVDHAGGIIFQQTDEHVADSLQLLCVLHGIDLSLRRKETSSKLPNARPMTRMRLSNAELRPGRRQRRSYEVFDNEEDLSAYCVEVETGAVVTRFDGHVAVSGNCVTKGKRRTVLSACGLGMLDETEVETIPGAAPIAATASGQLAAPANDSGHGRGQYASAEETKAYLANMEGYVKERNAKWVDRWVDDHTGEIPAGVKDLCNIWQADNHLVKWAIQTGRLDPASMPDDRSVKNSQIGRYTAIVYHRSRAEQAALGKELARYLDQQQERQEEAVRKLHPELFGDGPAGDDTPDEAAAMADEDPAEDEH